MASVGMGVHRYQSYIVYDRPIDKTVLTCLKEFPHQLEQGSRGGGVESECRGRVQGAGGSIERSTGEGESFSTTILFQYCISGRRSIEDGGSEDQGSQNNSHM